MYLYMKVCGSFLIKFGFFFIVYISLEYICIMYIIVFKLVCDYIVRDKNLSVWDLIYF